MKTDKFEKAALILGVMAVVFTFTFTLIPAFILSGLGILFAILSKGYESVLSRNSKLALVFSTLAILINFSLIGASGYLYFFNEEFHQEAQNYIQEIDSYYQDTYGISLEDVYGDL